ncbi:hypothetical protein [Gracilibacillus kekensis]|nr:hypothetical protein [Gracilibacillus kekensis]
MIHIVFGAAATNSLTYALQSKSHKVIGFPIDFRLERLLIFIKKAG